MWNNSMNKLDNVEKIRKIDDTVLNTNMKEILADGEESYSEWWRAYFKATNIVERKNRKLHLQHVPRRYWQYLTEKQ